MTQAIKTFNDYKREISYAKEWKEKIGQHYAGGGGGTGEIRTLEVKAVVYHQYANGDTNYHDMPTELAIALAQVVKARAGELLNLAMERMESRRIELAKAATDEHARLMQEAGIEA